MSYPRHSAVGFEAVIEAQLLINDIAMARDSFYRKQAISSEIIHSAYHPPLKEHGAALSAAVVTGKINVQERSRERLRRDSSYAPSLA